MKRTMLLAVLLLCAALGFAQTPINAPQYNVNLNFLTGGPYGQSSALDVSFGSQFTTNNMLQADFITMPGPSYTGFFGGDSWNISPACPLLATTSLSCGKFMPFVTGQFGLGRLAPQNGTTEQGFAALASIGANYDPTGSGKYSLLLKGGWGHFGPSLPGLSSNGFFIYSGMNFGAGSSALATEAKVARIQDAERKKMKKLQAAAKKLNERN
jgi:hypothetical protein